MGVRVEVEEGERIGQALRRLRKLLLREGTYYHLQRHAEYRKPGEVRRHKKLMAKVRARQAANRRRLELGMG